LTLCAAGTTIPLEMTYFPPPYSPPMGDFNFPPMLPPHLQRPARQASVLLMILAILALVVAGMAFMVSTIPLEQWPPEQLQKIQQQLIQPTGLSMKAYFRATAATMGLAGLVLGVLGLLVRGGRRWVIVTAMVVNGLMLILMITSILSAIMSAQPMSAFPPLVLLAIMVVLTQRLVAAFKAAGQAKAMAAQNWQQFQLPADGGYGFMNPLPPPPSAPPAPGNERK
jgi:hypothetical protein